MDVLKKDASLFVSAFILATRCSVPRGLPTAPSIQAVLVHFRVCRTLFCHKESSRGLLGTTAVTTTFTSAPAAHGGGDIAGWRGPQRAPGRKMCLMHNSTCGAPLKNWQVCPLPVGIQDRTWGGRWPGWGHWMLLVHFKCMFSASRTLVLKTYPDPKQSASCRPAAPL